jgi:hypothetical protein
MGIPRDANGRVQLGAVKSSVLHAALRARAWPSPAVREAAADSLAIALHVADVRGHDEAAAYLRSWLEARDSNGQRHDQLQTIIDEQQEGYSESGDA